MGPESRVGNKRAWRERKGPQAGQGFWVVGQPLGEHCWQVPGHTPTQLPGAQTVHTPLCAPICRGRKGGRS